MTLPLRLWRRICALHPDYRSLDAWFTRKGYERKDASPDAWTWRNGHWECDALPLWRPRVVHAYQPNGGAHAGSTLVEGLDILEEGIGL